jgi:hypothetical protein
MKINCRKCGRPLSTGDEIKYLAFGYYQDLPSKRVFSVSKPHEVIADSLEHVDCYEEEVGA